MKTIEDRFGDIIHSKATLCEGCDSAELSKLLETLRRAFYGKGEIVYDAAQNEIRLDETDMFLSEDFIISASFNEFRKAAKEKCYLQTWHETQATSLLGVMFYKENDYKIGSWLHELEYDKRSVDGKTHTITVIREHGFNKSEISTTNVAKSIKLFINGKFIKDYADNYNQGNLRRY